MADVFVPNVSKIKKVQGARKKTLTSGVVYVGHLPHGLFEQELVGYFSQFGTVTRVKVCRNRKSGRCKGFGFVEFQCDEVAKIVAQTMNNYLMFNKLLKCQFIGHANVHPGMLGNKKKDLRKEVSLRIRRCKAQKEHNKPQTANEHRKRVQRLMLKEKKKRNRLINLGITYDFPGYKSCIEDSNYARKPLHVKFEGC